MLGMASNAKEKQRKGERKSSRGSRGRRRRGGEKRQLARLVASLGNNSMAKSIDAARRWPRAPRFALACRATPTHTVPQKLVACSFGRSLGWVSCIGCFSGAASVISSIIIVGSIKTKSQIKLLLQHATCNKNGDNVSIVVVVFMLCLCPPARLTTSAASASLPTACDTPFPPGQVESY